ncbi:MAG: methyltransferase domain-containing protein, partial [bacterium]
TLDLKDKAMIDIPAGKGHTTETLHKQGAKPAAYDLFPEFFEIDGLSCQKANLAKKLPIANQQADYVVCQEGIEHLQDQFSPLQEFNRVLKPNGRLILTTPSISHIRAKLSNLCIESEIYNRLPANELDSVWFSEGQEIYFGHIFLIGIQKLRVLAKLAGFKIVKIHKVKASPSALLIGIFAYPLIVIFSLYAYFVSIRRLKIADAKAKKKVYGEILKLNLHPAIQFGKHLFIEFEKEVEYDKIKHALNKSKAEIC